MHAKFQVAGFQNKRDIRHRLAPVLAGHKKLRWGTLEPHPDFLRRSAARVLLCYIQTRCFTSISD